VHACMQKDSERYRGTDVGKECDEVCPTHKWISGRGGRKNVYIDGCVCTDIYVCVDIFICGYEIDMQRCNAS